MAKFKIFYTIIFLLFISVESINAQPVYYVRMQDATGIDISSYQTALNDAAHDLTLALPSTFQANFKVYDYGFYLHNDKMEGGVDKILTDAENDVKALSTYYLMICRVLDSKGNLSYFVRMRVPTTGDLSCLNPALFTYLQFKVRDKLIVSMDASVISGSIISGMNELKEYIIDKIHCCTHRESCDESCMNSEAFAKLLEAEGFIYIPVDDISVSAPDQNNFPDVEELTNIVYTSNGIQHNVNEEVRSFIQGLDDIFEIKKAIIEEYRTDGTCYETILNVSQKPDQDKFNLELKVVVDKNQDKSKELAFKLNTNFYDLIEDGVSENGKIYIYFNEGAENMKSVIDQTKDFYLFAGIETPILKPINNLKELKAVRLHKNDGLIFVGQMESVRTLFNNKTVKDDVIDASVYTYFISPFLANFYYNFQNPERTFENVVVLLTNQGKIPGQNLPYPFDNLLEEFAGPNNSNHINKNRAIGFVNLHVLAHIAGYVHIDSDSDPHKGVGWCASAPEISTELNTYLTFENLITHYRFGDLKCFIQTLKTNAFFESK